MANESWKRVKEAFKEPDSPEARKEAARALQRFQEEKRAKGKRSKPTIVSLGYKKGYPSSIPLNELPQQVRENPAVYNLLKEVVTRER